MDKKDAKLTSNEFKTLITIFKRTAGFLVSLLEKVEKGEKV